MWNISYVLSTLFRQLVILMRYDSFCFDYQKTSSALATTYKRRYVETHKEHISRQQFGNLSVDISAEKQGLEKNMLSVNWMDQQPWDIDAVH